MIKSRIVTIEGLDYEIEDNEGRWSVHMPEVLNLPSLHLHSYMLKNDKDLQPSPDFGYEDALKILHSVLERLPQARPVGLHELTAKERVTLERCGDLLARVTEVPELRVALFLSPKLMSTYCTSCKNPLCDCGGKSLTVMARKSLQSFELALKAMVYSVALHKRPFDEDSDDHIDTVHTLFTRLVLQLAQGES